VLNFPQILNICKYMYKKIKNKTLLWIIRRKSSQCHVFQRDHRLHKKWQGFLRSTTEPSISKSLVLQRFSFFQFNHCSQTHALTLSWPISPGLSIWLCLLLIYYSNSPVSTCGWLLRRDHLMIDGSPEVTQGWGAKEIFGIQQTSWNQLDTTEIMLNSEERSVKVFIIY